MAYKPYVTAVPDILEIPLSGNEDFLILACDGLWDFISEQQAARCVYEVILENPGIYIIYFIYIGIEN